MFVGSTRLNSVLSALFVVALGACGDFGGCGACGAVQPLPGGKLPDDQTIEGGAQIRVTQQGFQKLTSVLPGLINSSFSGGFCVPKGTVGDPYAPWYDFATGAEWCYANDGGCTPGCEATISVNPNGLSTSVVGPQTLRVNLSTTISGTVPLRGQVIGVLSASCSLDFSSNNLGGSFDIAFGIRPDNGELDIHLAQINQFNLNLTFNGCGLLSDIGNLATDIIDSFIGQFIIGLLTPTVDDLLQSFLPSPLGIAGLMDIGAALEGVSPGTEALMEGRIVPGGYVRLDTQSRGMSLGVITGMNADEDITTRTPDLDNEPSLCVPPIAAPAFGTPPHNLPLTARNTFGLAAAGAFDGMPDPAADVAMGLSETFLDLAGHHLVTSGAMCLGIGTATINQLNVGTIGILVPSLAELTSDTGRDPLLLVTRPQKAIDFTIGDNTAASPALTIGLHNLEVDFYAFLYERYVRAFTIDLTMNIGLGLDFEQMPGQPAFLKPTLVGLSASAVTVKVLNSEFVRETPQELEAVLPSVFDLVTPLLGNLPPIQVPSFAGFSLNNLSIQRVTTSQDDFLALYATLGAGAVMRELGTRDVFAKAAVMAMDRELAAPGTPSAGRARLRGVVTPPPAQIRAALAARDGGAMPEVAFDVDRVDAQGRELEWSYNLDGGLWRPFATVGPEGLVVRDRAFAWQGKYEIGLVSRVKGDYTTTSVETRTPVIIDSVGPKIAADKLQWDEDTLQIPLWDIVSEHAIQYAFGKPGDAAPRSAWRTGGMAELARDAIAPYLVDGELLVFARDEAGNQTIAMVAPFHGQAGEAGCSCQTSGPPSAGGVALVLLVGVGLFGRRGRGRRIAAALDALWRGRTRTRLGRAATTVALWAGASVAMSLQPGCSCGDAAGKACEVAEDCGPGACLQGQLPFCIDNTCVCADDIPPGRIGPYSDIGVGGDGSMWVSAYAQTYGDLVVARVEPGRVPVESWEWVDGVPDGPVTVPGSSIRRGIDGSGPDVGMYTSIAVNASGTPMVTYFDRDTSSLKFAAKVNDAWQIHTIQPGTGPTLGEYGELTGMFSSLTLRTDDGRPGVAFLAHVMDANGGRAEVRYAAAQTAVPTGPGDWQFWVVDTAPLPPSDPENPNIYPLPEGLGLFVDSARLPNQAPVVAYYDRSNGDLKVAKFNPQTGQFAAAVTLDGTDVDAGWTPSVAVDAQGVVHVAYVGSTKDDLKYVTDAQGALPEVVDDGYRIVGMSPDGLPKPEFHFVGEDASLVLAGGTVPMIAYQDATTQELLLATKQQDGSWQHISIAGATDPWPGAYGFFASTGLRSTEMVMSTWVINQPGEAFDNNWVEVFTRPTTILRQ